MAKKKMSMGWQARILVAILMITAVVFLPITIMLTIGMLPTIISRLIDKSPEATKVLTVGFMNFAGCFPFCYKLFQDGNKIDNSMEILSDPLTIVIMYSCAAIGYAIEWLVTSVVAGIMVQRGRKRLEAIKNHQESLVTQWGQEVTGEIPLDPYGFPLEPK